MKRRNAGLSFAGDQTGVNPPDPDPYGHCRSVWDQYGPGATGVGWELDLVGLALHLIDPDAPKLDEEAFAQSPDGKAFMQRSATAWGEADIARGEDPTQARVAAKRTAGFYTGETSQQD